MVKNIFVVVGLTLLLASAGCLTNGDVAFRPELLKLPSPRHRSTVILVSSQGSTNGNLPECSYGVNTWSPGGSQFVDYVLYNYADQAHFIPEPLMSSRMNPPTEGRLQEIVADISKAIGHNEHDVDVWAFSLGADSMYFIADGVKNRVGSTERMHVLLIDPMILDDPLGKFLVEIHADLGMPIAKFLRQVAPYIKENREHWLNLSGGTVINLDLSWNPVLLLTKFINADRHYSWAGKTQLERDTLNIIDARLILELQRLNGYYARSLVK